MKPVANLVLIGVLFFCLRAQGNIIVSLQPESSTINIGTITGIDVVVSGLGDHTSPSLRGFDWV